MRTKLLTALLATAAGALGAVPASAAAATDVQQAASENWSGYVANPSAGNGFSSVSGSWVQPTATCTSGSGYAAFWVGLGGSGQSDGSGSGQSEALEQAGTEADCSSSGQARYFAWYELVPAAPVRLGLTITPGDHITTRVGVSGSTVTITLNDETSGQSVSKTLSMSNPDTSSAEWIAEAPSSCSQSATDCSPLPLANFGTVNFSGATATSGGHTGSISDPSWTATQVALQSGVDGYGGPQFSSSDASSGAGATPSSLSGDGESFSVAWSDGGSSSSTAAGGGSGYGYGSGDPGYAYGGGYGYGGGDPGYGYGDGSGYSYGGGSSYYGVAPGVYTYTY